MKKRLAAKLAIASASLVLVLTSVHAADNPSPSEKAKPIDPVAKPSIAKPSDALVPKTKDGANQAPAAAAQTPAGRPINDLKVMTGSPNTAKAGAAPAVSNAQAPATAHSTTTVARGQVTDNPKQKLPPVNVPQWPRAAESKSPLMLSAILQTTKPLLIAPTELSFRKGNLGSALGTYQFFGQVRFVW